FCVRWPGEAQLSGTGSAVPPQQAKRGIIRLKKKRGLVGRAVREESRDKRFEMTSIVARIKAGKPLACCVVADAISRSFVPGRAPEPLIWISYLDGVAPVVAVVGKPRQRTMLG